MMDTPTQEQFMAEFANAANYVDDILNGKITPAEALNFPEESLEGFFKEAQNALQLEDYPKAEEMFTTLVVMNNKDTRAVLGLAGALEGQEKYDMATLFYFLMMASTPLDPVAPFRAGICLVHLGKKEEAIKCFSLAADCKEEIKDPAKTVYVDKAKGMLNRLTEGE